VAVPGWVAMASGCGWFNHASAATVIIVTVGAPLVTVHRHQLNDFTDALRSTRDTPARFVEVSK